MTAARGYVWAKAGAPPDLNKGGQQALKKKGPIEPAEAKSLISALLGANAFAYSEADFVLVLEALVGPEVLIDAASDAMEQWKPEDFLGWGDKRRMHVRTLGYPLIRLAKAGAGKRRDRLESLFGKWEKAAPGGKLAVRRGGVVEQPIQGLDVILHGARGVQRSGERVKGHIDPYYATFVHDDPKFVLEVVKKAGKPEKWMAPIPRLSFLGGDPVLDLMLKWWPGYLGGDGHAEVVHAFSEFRSPKVVELMVHISATSKARGDALAWLSAHADCARPIVEKLASGKGDPAKWARAALASMGS